ncbi:WD40 repeat domain-containing protein [Nocardiopsis akebiae]|uniref:WD40 repeat domain-containing protein n=2 Tax=Nocardiopsis akebiae TaxID=2831968 RepID=A0ABX8CGP6_9ACTN|nr:WD40 repeat domain-containing protein [Nocardiopsis akebiae]
MPATLTDTELRDVITRPAQTAGARVEEGLAEEVVEDLHRASAADGQVSATLLPPLALVLNRLWERRVDGRLTRDAYTRIGGAAVFLAAGKRRERQSVHRPGRFNAVLAGLVALTLIATGLAVWQRQSVLTARSDQRAAQSRQLAAQSRAVFDSDLELASLLAVQAYRTSPTREATASLYNAADTGLEGSFDNDSDGVASVAFSPDGTTLATSTAGGISGDVHLWDAATGEMINTFYGYDTVIDASFSPDGATLATGDEEGVVHLWDTTGDLLHDLTGHGSWVNAVAFSPDGATLATGSADGTARLWDTATGEQLQVLSDGLGEVFDVEFSPDGATLATGSEDGTARLWDTADHEERRAIDPGGDLPVYDVLFGSDGDVLVTNTTTAVSLWDTRNGSQVQTLTTTGRPLVDTVTVSPDGATLAYGLTDGRVRLWDTGGTASPRTLVNGRDPVFDLAFSPDGTSLATGGLDDGTVHLWDAAFDARRHVLDAGETGWDDVAFGPDGTYLTTTAIRDASWDGTWDETGTRESRWMSTVRFWDASTGEEHRTLTGYELDGIFFTGVDGSTLVTTENVGELTVHLWDAATGERRHTFSARGNEVFDPAFSSDDDVLHQAFSPDGSALALIHEYGAVWLWDTATGEQIHTFVLGEEPVAHTALSADGETLATVQRRDHGQSVVRLWNAATGERLHTLTGYDEDVSVLEFSPDGSLLATETGSEFVYLWDAATGERLHTLSLDEGSVSSMEFSPDGTLLATGTGSAGATHLWDTATGALRRTFPDSSDGFVELLAFSPDGTRLATSTGTDDGVRVWDVDLPDAEEAAARICGAFGRDFTVEERALHLPGLSDGPACAGAVGEGGTSRDGA